MSSRSRRTPACAAAALLAVCALATAAPAGALTVDPQNLADSLGLPQVPGAPALPSVTIPDPPSQVATPELGRELWSRSQAWTSADGAG